MSSSDIIVPESVDSLIICTKCNQSLKKNMFSKKGLLNKTCNKCHRMAEQKLLSDLKNCMFSYPSPIASHISNSNPSSQVHPVDRSGGKDGKKLVYARSGEANGVVMKHNKNNGNNRIININLKHESEIIQKESSKFVAGELPIRNELKIVGDQLRSGSLMILDLHNTADLFLNDQIALNLLAEIKQHFGLVVILSFVGKTDGPNSTRYQARADIQHLISIGLADFGFLVFQRGPAKGWMCDTLSQVFNRGIYFSDDSDDHLESVQTTVPKERLLSIHQSDPSKSSDLFNWIQHCSTA